MYKDFFTFPNTLLYLKQYFIFLVFKSFLCSAVSSLMLGKIG